MATSFDSIAMAQTSKITAAAATADTIYFADADPNDPTHGFIEKTPLAPNSTPMLLARGQKLAHGDRRRRDEGLLGDVRLRDHEPEPLTSSARRVPAADVRHERIRFLRPPGARLVLVQRDRLRE